MITEEGLEKAGYERDISFDPPRWMKSINPQLVATVQPFEDSEGGGWEVIGRVRNRMYFLMVPNDPSRPMTPEVVSIQTPDDIDKFLENWFLSNR